MRRLLSLAALFLWIGAACAQGIAPLPLKIGGQYTGGCGISRPLPGDATTITWSAGGDVCALKQSWCNGKPLFDIIVGGATKTINSVNCFPDVRRLAALLGISPVSGTAGAPLSKLYDQLGGTTGFVQTTAANRPAIWLINGRVAMAYDGAMVDFITGVNADRYLTFPGITTDNQNTTAYAAIQASTTAPATTFSTLFNTSPAGSSGFMISSGSSWGGAIWFAPFTGITISPALFTETQPSVIGVVAGSGSVNLTQNEESGSSAAFVAGTSTGGFLGAVPFFGPQNSGFFGRMYGFMIAGAAQATSGQQTALRNAFYGLHGIAKATPKYNVLVDGASVDAGMGSLIAGINGYGWAEQMLALLPYPIRVSNTSFPGAKILDLNATMATYQCSFFPATGTNVLIGPGFAAGNTIVVTPKTGAQAFTDLQTYITSAKACAHPPTIFIVYLLGSDGGDAEQDYNNLVIANAASMGLTPIGGGPNAGYLNTIMAHFSSGNTQYFNQSATYAGHPNIIGYQNMSLPPLAAIRSLLGP